MGQAPPSIPWTWRLALGIGWLVALAALALLRDPVTPWNPLLAILLESAAVALGAVFLGASLLERLQRRAWRRRTELHAIDGIERFVEQLRAVGERSIELVAGPGPLTDEALEVIGLPWSAERAAALESLRGKTAATLGLGPGTAPQASSAAVTTGVGRAVLRRFASDGPALREAIDALERRASDLEAYLDEPLGHELRARAVEFRRASRGTLATRPPRGVAPGVDALVAEFATVLAVTTMSQVLGAIPAVASAADQAVVALRARLTNDRLRAELDRVLQAGRGEAAILAEERRADEELQALLASFDKARADYFAAGEALSDDLARLEASPDPREREYAIKARDEIRSIGDELRSAFGEYSQQPPEDPARPDS